MNEEQMTPETESYFDSLAADEEYWDYLDRMEFELGGSREWDNAQ